MLHYNLYKWSRYIFTATINILVSEQDRGLENLSQIISRQKNIAQTISDEVEYHNGK